MMISVCVRQRGGGPMALPPKPPEGYRDVVSSGIAIQETYPNPRRQIKL